MEHKKRIAVATEPEDYFVPSWCNHYDDICALEVELLLNEYLKSNDSKQAIKNVSDYFVNIIQNSVIVSPLSFSKDLIELIINDFGGLQADIFAYTQSQIFSKSFQPYNHGKIIDVKIHNEMNVYSIFFSDNTIIGIFAPNPIYDSTADECVWFYETGELDDFKSASKITHLLIYENGILTRHKNSKFGQIEAISTHSLVIKTFSKRGCQGMVGKGYKRKDCKNNFAIGCWNHCCKRHCKEFDVCKYHYPPR